MVFFVLGDDRFMVRKDKELELNWETLFSVGAFSGNDFYEFYLNDNIRPADSSEISVERSKLYRDPDMLRKNQVIIIIKNCFQTISSYKCIY